MNAAAPTRSRRPMIGVITAMGVSLTGTRISAIALPWFVLSTTGSASKTGLVALFEIAPYVTAKALAGPLIDRVGPRIISWTTDTVSALSGGAVVLLHSLGLLNLWSLLALVAVIGTTRGPGDMAKEVMIPDAAEAAGVPLERATGIGGVVERLAMTAGPAAGGTLVALIGPIAGLLVNAVSFALGSLIIAVLVPSRRAVHDKHSGETGGESGDSPPLGYWRRFGEGIAFLRQDKLLLAVAVMVGFTNLLDMAYSSVLLPVWARETGGGPAAIGTVGTVFGISAVCGSLVATGIAHRMPRRLVYLLGFLIAGAPRFVVLASGAPMWGVLPVMVLGGFGAGFINPILSAVILERIPRHKLGRVGSLVDSLAWSGMPLGGVVAGGLIALGGLTPALLICAAAYFAATTLPALRPEWAEMDRGRRQRVPRQRVPRQQEPRQRAPGRQDGADADSPGVPTGRQPEG